MHPCLVYAKKFECIFKYVYWKEKIDHEKGDGKMFFNN